MNFNTILKIVRLGRLQFILGGFLFFCAGALLALLLNAQFNLEKLIMGYAALFAAHLSVSYSNDYFDFEVDQFQKPTRFSGGSGVLVTNPELREFSKNFALLLMGLSIFLAIITTILFQLPVSFFILILGGNLLGWYYSAPPLRLSYRGLSELATVLTGFIVPGIGYVILMGKLDLNFLIFAIPLMLYELLFIINVEIPDMEADSLGGKKTAVVVHGRQFGFIIGAIAAVMATLSFLFMPLINLNISSINWTIITIFSLIPLGLGVLSVRKKPVNRKSAIKLVNHNLLSLSIFIILVNTYFIYSI
ncbi:prenyltransferase [uncultured Methanobacterium sp.]|uniref:prenyltransferase n=1 Tax=uncultured Methanobacterium sp. TaxID=176306 RepID=UPI002AA66CE2|nr:prenyltransferase [uncultured Methanobacterium sp.]